MPFSHDAFFEVFAIYNRAFWPVVLGLWLATLIAYLQRSGEPAGRTWVFGLLAIQWVWSGVVYHAGLFSQINPAAWLFAALFVTQAGLLAWHGVVRRRLEFSSDCSNAVLAGYGLIAYGLLYPLIAFAGGQAYPRLATFGVPCPTTIVTAGFLILLRGRVPAALAIVPVIWAAIGGSAAFLLGVYADLALLVAGGALAFRTWFTRVAAVT